MAILNNPSWSVDLGFYPTNYDFSLFYVYFDLDLDLRHGKSLCLYVWNSHFLFSIANCYFSINRCLLFFVPLFPWIFLSILLFFVIAFFFLVFRLMLHLRFNHCAEALIFLDLETFFLLFTWRFSFSMLIRLWILRFWNIRWTTNKFAFEILVNFLAMNSIISRLEYRPSAWRSFLSLFWVILNQTEIEIIASIISVSHFESS